MKTTSLLSCLFLISSLCASELTTINSCDILFELSQTDRGYSLKSDTFALHFPRHQVSKSIRDLRADQLAALLKSNAYYLKATELSDGTHTLDLHGRVNGGGLATGAFFGYVFGKVIVPGIIVVPGTIGLFATKAFIHMHVGPVAAAEFGERMNTQMIPHMLDVAMSVGDAVAPYAAVVGGVTGGPV